MSNASKTPRRLPSAPDRVADDYLDLVKQLPLRPLRDDQDYDRAAAMLDRLVVRIDLTPGETDYMDALTLFVEAYDDEHHNPDDADLSPLDMLKFLLEQHGMNTSQLGEVLGSKGVASEVLNGKRQLSKSHIAKLSVRFGVEPGVFLQPRARTLDNR